jgi:hypothetical protein
MMGLATSVMQHGIVYCKCCIMQTVSHIMGSGHSGLWDNLLPQLSMILHVLLDYWTMDKIQTSINPGCHTPSSEPSRTYTIYTRDFGCDCRERLVTSQFRYLYNGVYGGRGPVGGGDAQVCVCVCVCSQTPGLLTVIL